MKPILLTVLVVVLAGCQSAPRITYSGASGSSLRQPVVIEGTADYEELQKAEKAWIAKKYPGSRIERRTIQGIDGRHYSILEVSTATGESRSVYFEVSDYFSHQ